MSFYSPLSPVFFRYFLNRVSSWAYTINRPPQRLFFIWLTILKNFHKNFLNNEFFTISIYFFNQSFDFGLYFLVNRKKKCFFPKNRLYRKVKYIIFDFLSNIPSNFRNFPYFFPRIPNLIWSALQKSEPLTIGSRVRVELFLISLAYKILKFSL